MDKPKTPINRINKFFSESDFDFNVSVGMEYFTDLNMKLVLYRVDHDKTNKNNVYSEVGKDQIIFKDPIEFNGLVKIEEPKNTNYGSSNVRHNEPGNLIVTVFIKHLEELGVDITYGDYIGYYDDEETLRYYSVVNDGKINSNNGNKMFGYKPFYRKITCVISQENEFRGI